MKLNKIFAIALAALTLTACSDDEDVNTADVTVSMAETTMNVSEDATAGVYYTIPIELSGKPNGPVTVVVDVEGSGTTPATEDDHYIITSKTITIGAGQTTGFVEFYPTGDEIENDDRQFTVKIVKATGARLGANLTTVVNLLDNERLLPEAYAKVIGTWQTSYATNAGVVNYNCQLEGFNSDEPGYLKQVKLKNFQNTSWFEDLILDFELDGSTGAIKLYLSLPQLAAVNVDFTGLGVADLLILPYFDDGLYLGGELEATSNADVTRFEFDGGAISCLFTPGNYSGSGFMGYTYRQTIPLTLTKVQ